MKGELTMKILQKMAEFMATDCAFLALMALAGAVMGNWVALLWMFGMIVGANAFLGLAQWAAFRSFRRKKREKGGIKHGVHAA